MNDDARLYQKSNGTTGTMGDVSLIPSDDVLATFQEISDAVVAQLKRLHRQGNFGHQFFKTNSTVCRSFITNQNKVMVRFDTDDLVVKKELSDGTTVDVPKKDIMKELKQHTHEVLPCFITIRVYTMRAKSSYGNATTCGVTLTARQIFLRPLTTEGKTLQLNATDVFTPATSAAFFL
jgi:hypothetical protein